MTYRLAPWGALSIALVTSGCFVDRSGLGGAGPDGGERPDGFVALDGGGVDAGPDPVDGSVTDAFVPDASVPDASVPPDTGPGCIEVGPEVCDAAMVDEDCDGMANEGCVCVTGEIRTCTHAPSACMGSETCEGPAWGDCVPLTSPSDCNGRDDDCDGTIDEGSGCETSGCARYERTTASSTSSYLICEMSVRWGAAQTFCAERGYDLVTIEDMAENSALLRFAEMEGDGSDRWWIGYGDPDDDDVWTWASGSSSYVFPGAPDGRGNCAVLDTGADDWGDTDCSGSWQGDNFFICEARRTF